MYPTERNDPLSRSLLWTRLGLILAFILAGFVLIYIMSHHVSAPLTNFDRMLVTENFSKIDLVNGQHFDITFETDQPRSFSGQIRYLSMDHIRNFPIISFDILITSGDFSDPAIVTTNVFPNHTFSWSKPVNTNPQGTINLIHAVPMDQKTEQKLMQLHQGETVTIEGREILRIDSYDRRRKFIGYWQDAGCNTTLITDVMGN